MRKVNMLILIGMLTTQVMCLTGCGRQEELVFETSSRQTEMATDELAWKELEQVEEQAEVGTVETGAGGSQPMLTTLEDLPQSTGTQEMYIYVDICGAVGEPGVYQMPEGSRLYEVIEQAGGLAEDAATRYVNQARVLMDGEQIVIFTEQEVEEALASGEMIATATPVAYGSPGAEASGQGQAAEKTQSAKVNINTASAQELMTLTGIGESKAKLIMQYREDNGGFSSTEEIMNIEGIGEKTYAKFAEDITVQ